VKLIALGTAALFIPLIAVVGLVTLVLAAATGAAPPPSPSSTAVADIPAGLVAVYQSAAQACGMSWEVLAAVGKVESDHGRSTAPGVPSGTVNSAGARGPMQFLDPTWRAFGVDADRDGQADAYDPVDAIWGAANYLCANGAGNSNTLRDALYAYNHSDAYVDKVLLVANDYRTTATASSTYALPTDRVVFAQHPEYLTSPHHDYPAIDIPVPIGSNVYAVTDGVVALVAGDAGICGGTVVINGDDGARYTYCHLSQELVEHNQRVETGIQIARSGGQPGAYGSGDATGPHLHFGVAVGGSNVCPQHALAGWFAGVSADPVTAPTKGCTT
jgi:murein DD-endopeptidase MepM/ murein hydrolase activator NlpD